MSESSPGHEARSPSRGALALAGAIVLASALIAALIVVGVFDSLLGFGTLPTSSAVTPGGGPTNHPVTATGASRPSEALIPEPISSSTAQPTGWTLLLAPRQPGDESPVRERFAAALEIALSEASLSAPLTVLDGPPAPIDQSSSSVTLLVTWEVFDRDTLAFYFIAAQQPGNYRVVDAPAPWLLADPGDTPLTAPGLLTQDFMAAAQIAVAFLEYLDGQPAAAVARLQDARGTLPDDLPPNAGAANDAVIDFYLGVSYAAQENFASALDAYSRAARQDEELIAARVNRGNVYVLLGDLEAALNDYAAALTLDPENAAALYGRVLAYRALGDSERALVEAAAVVDQAPDAPWSHNLRGAISYERGEFTAALIDFEQALLIAPDDPAIQFNRGMALLADGQAAEAAGAFSAVLDQTPGDPLAHLYLGMAYRAQEDLARAERAFNWAIALCPACAEGFIQRAGLYLEMDDPARALADAEAALGLDPDAIEAFRASGEAHLALGNYADAAAAYGEIVDRGLADAGVYAQRGTALQYQGFTLAALEDYDRAIDLGMKEPAFLLRVGLALLDQGRFEEALVVLREAADGLDTPEAHAALAVALDANLERAEAERAYMEALDGDARYGDPDYLREQPFWTELVVARAETILLRLDEGAGAD